MIDDLKESRREKLIVKSVIVLVCVGTDDDIWVHRSKHSLFTQTAKFLCVFWMIVTTFGDVLGNEYLFKIGEVLQCL